MNKLKTTPLHECYSAHDGKLIEFFGWELPVQFEGIVQEHMAVRQAAGLFDVSHMGEVKVIGEDAQAFIQYLITNDIAKMSNNDVLYTLMCYEYGGVVDDLLVYKFSSTHYLLVINASNIEKDVEWIQQQASSYHVMISNLSDELSELALQGPMAEQILQELTDEKLKDIGFFQFKNHVLIQGIDCLVSRTGYTGEDGFEIFTDNCSISRLWQLLLEKGAALGLKPAGLGCRDTLRLEAALSLYGQELSKDISPLEAGLGYFVKLDKDNFIGQKALLKQKKEGLKRRIVGFELLDKGIARHGYPIFNEKDEVIGFVTTGYQSPSLNKSIGLAMIDINYTKLDTVFYIQVRKRKLKAQVISKKFYNKKYKKS